MSGNKKGWNEKVTICWDCQNFSRCSWSRGKPVKGWKAIPTRIENIIDGYLHITDSFLVEDCPQFKADKKRRVYVKDIADIIGVNKRTIYRLVNYSGHKRLGAMLKEKGYKLHVYKEERLHSYYLEKL